MFKETKRNKVMTQYIDKAALVAEIEKLISNGKLKCQQSQENNDQVSYIAWSEHIATCGKILSFLNTLEVKEVDLEKEMSEYFVEHSDEFFSDKYKLFAKHFFELGIKAQHDNWKVVDNINPPQADKNKIYCVLSKKNKYLLAKVINHPKDEELLQWRCTEFPFHRYDMCEGDKYMQIV